jgi:LysR family hydrogen peroxide-inducible transcriptional activator
MEMNQLRYVVAVARTGNFSRAAELCKVSQPSLSQQIQKLEDELGERLFDRTKRHTKLTSHGELFFRRAVFILEEAERAIRDAAEAKSLVSGTCTIGVLPTIAPYLLPEAVAVFARKYPGVEIVVQEDTTAHLIKQLMAYEVDFAFASHPIQDSRLEIKELFTEELLLALPPDHSLARKRTVPAAALKGERFIVMREEHCLGDQVVGYCNHHDVKPTISFRSAQLETIQALVSAGLGLSLVPAMAAAAARPNALEYRSIQGSRPERAIIAIWPRQRPLGRAAQAFLDLMPTRGRLPQA